MPSTNAEIASGTDTPIEAINTRPTSAANATASSEPSSAGLAAKALQQRTGLLDHSHCACPAIMAPISARRAGSAMQDPMIRPR